MNQFRRPSAEEIEARLARRDEAVTYPEMGATMKSIAELRATLPSSYNLDTHVFPLGTGRSLYERARKSIFAWHQLEIPWLEFYQPSRSPQAGDTVATLVSVAGLWFFNPCRVIYIDGLEELADVVTVAYGTLDGHVERGEERFQVSFNRADETVTFQITAFSRPAVFLAKLGYPITRVYQRRFAKSSAAALARAIE